MNKYAHYLSLLGLLVGSSLSAQTTTVKGGFKNVVIGEGCASTCINGKCEKTCNGEKSDSKASYDEQTGDTTAASKSFDFVDFDDIVVDGFNATVVKADEFGVSVSAEQGAIESVDVSLELKAGRSVLKVSLSDTYSSTSVDGFVLIHMPVLSSLRAYGNADVNIRGFDAQEANIEFSGNTNLIATDNTFEKLSLRVDDNADVDLMQSEIVNADISLNDRANAKLNFDQSKTAELSGSLAGMSDVEFCGSPQQSLKISDMSDATEVDCS